MTTYRLAEIRKLLIHVAAFVVTILATVLSTAADLIPDKWLPVVLVVVAVGSSYGLFRVPNERPQPTADTGTGQDHDAVVVALSRLDVDPSRPS